MRRALDLDVDKVKPNSTLAFAVTFPTVHAIRRRLVALQMPLSTCQATSPDPFRLCRRHGRGLLRRRRRRSFANGRHGVIAAPSNLRRFLCRRIAQRSGGQFLSLGGWHLEWFVGEVGAYSVRRRGLFVELARVIGVVVRPRAETKARHDDAGRSLVSRQGCGGPSFSSA
jgi:hypothetical protein